jgi:FkbM family methyltransferase
MELTKIIADTNAVYDRLQDELSKYFFQKRLTYALTHDFSVMQEAYRTVFKMKVPTDKKVVAFGGGTYVSRIPTFKHEFDINIVAVIDNHPKPNHLEIEVTRATDFLRDKKEDITLQEYVFFLNVSLSTMFAIEMREQLLESGVLESAIFDYSDLFQYAVKPDMTPMPEEESKPLEQYFDLGFPFDENEVFVDAGVYDGLSSISFARKVNGKYRGIYAFEPDEKSFALSECNFKKVNLDVTLVEQGLWNINDKLIFHLIPGGSSSIAVNQSTNAITQSINVTTLDDYFKDKEDKPTFIKMDIEGAELNALIGGEKIIREYKPKLAICVYHKPEDLLQIPQLLVSYRPDYKIFLRKYTAGLADEYVMYFI